MRPGLARSSHAPGGSVGSVGAPGTDTAVVVRDLSAGYGRLRALDGVSFTLSRGEMAAVIGPNGAGKTTLLRAMAGLLPFSGSVTPAPGLSAARVAFIPQRLGFDPSFPITVGGLVGTGRRALTGRWRRLRAADHTAIEQALEMAGLAGLAGRSIGALSGGQLQRAVLARALAQEADVLLLDEPLSGVDTPSREILLGLLGELCATGRTVLLSTHDLGLVRTSFSRCLGVNRALLVDGPASAALGPDALDLIFRAPEPIWAWESAWAG